MLSAHLALPVGCGGGGGVLLVVVEEEAPLVDGGVGGGNVTRSGPHRGRAVLGIRRQRR